MNEEQKMDVAIFRFGVISDFVNGKQLERGEQDREMADVHKIITQVSHPKMGVESFSIWSSAVK